MRLVHYQATKHSNTLKESLKRHLVKIYFSICLVLLNIISIVTCFVDWCVSVGLLTKEKQDERNWQEVHMRAPKSHWFWNTSWCSDGQKSFMGLQREVSQAWCKGVSGRRAFLFIYWKAVSKWSVTLDAPLFWSKYYWANKV